ncbi:MAG: hypothetical protein J0M34_06575 [Alphaproteobacteria bacterium]|nr:hypothetical protein [Alphaproteobacteria bacterium]
MSDHSDAKKLKKKLQNLKNRRHQVINQHAEQHGRERDLDLEREEELRDSAREASERGAKNKKDEPTWSARMQEVRNKLDGRKRMAEDRWNRFAGTEGGGGRGL